jgi:hypothetical protein
MSSPIRILSASRTPNLSHITSASRSTNFRPLFTTAAALLSTYIFYRLFLYSQFFSPLRHIPGPPKESIVYGNMPSIVREPPGFLHTQWSEKYGGVTKYTGVFGVSLSFARRSVADKRG